MQRPSNFAVRSLLLPVAAAAIAALVFAGCDEEAEIIAPPQPPAAAPEDSGAQASRPDRLRVCSQNLYRYGETGARAKKRKKQLSYLVTRMRSASCDVIAVQEIAGKNQKQAQAVLERLATALSQRSGRMFTAVAGKSRDSHISNGFLFARARLRLLEVRSHWRDELPKLEPRAAARSYSRGPLLAVFELQQPLDGERTIPPGNNGAKAPLSRLVLINFHLKSKAQGWKDPSGTKYEIARMEAAEGIRNMAAAAREEFGGNALVMVLGDRNSPPQSASAEVLHGRRLLRDFARGGPCRLSQGLGSLCGEQSPRKPQLVGLFARRYANAPGETSYRFRGKPEQIDEISVFEQDSGYLRRDDGRPAVGYRGQFGKGSDHRLLWAEIRAPQREEKK